MGVQVSRWYASAEHAEWVSSLMAVTHAVNVLLLDLTLMSAQRFVHEMPRPLDLPPGLRIQMLLSPSMLLCVWQPDSSARACTAWAFSPSQAASTPPAQVTLSETLNPGQASLEQSGSNHPSDA